MLHVFPGRLQPPHNDHFALIRAALAAVPGRIYLGLIVHVPALVGDPWLEAERNHEPERNPLGFPERHAILEAGLASEVAERDRARLVIVPLPRPEVGWCTITAIFPGPRTWIVPAVGEDWDEHKARFFTARGDHVLRVTAPTTTDGWTVRKLLAARDPALRRHLPRAVFEQLMATGQMEVSK